MKTLFDVEFIRPYFAWLFVVVLPFCMMSYRLALKANPWQKICSEPLLKYLLAGESRKTNLARWFLSVGLIAAVLALMGPSFEKTEQAVLNIENPLMIVLDMSDDMNKTDVKPSRLKRAKIELTDILQKVNAHPSGLIVYTSEPFVVSPLSEDENVALNLLKAVDFSIMPANGNRPDRAIEMAAERLKESGYAKGNILVVSAGLPDDFQRARQAAKSAFEKGFNVSVLNVSPFESKAFEDLARVSKGGYGSVERVSNNALLSVLEGQNLTDLKQTQNKISVLEDDGYWLLFAVAVCLLYFFKKGVLFCLLMCIFALDVQAGFFLNSNQEAAKLFEAQDYQNAALKFDDENWKGAAYYKAQDYQNAARFFEKNEDIEGRYNLANALAKSGDLKKAIELYESVVAQNPKHEDAAFNLEYVKKMMQNQSKQNEKNKENDEENKENTQNQNGQSDAQDEAQNEQEKQNGDENQAENGQAQDQNDAQNDDLNQEQKNSETTSPESEKNEAQDEAKQNENDAQNQKNDSSFEEKQAEAMKAKEGAENEKYDEKVQARRQQFREIKEDTGGLLRAIIKQEYLKNRYGN
ncbi:MAG: VWA domain-containing protein [Alphaproteobacteria bacterium]|nr:VWA domain-containing protein [Alphaproteobacteria bacterium]